MKHGSQTGLGNTLGKSRRPTSMHGARRRTAVNDLLGRPPSSEGMIGCARDALGNFWTEWSCLSPFLLFQDYVPSLWVYSPSCDACACCCHFVVTLLRPRATLLRPRSNFVATCARPCCDLVVVIVAAAVASATIRSATHTCVGNTAKFCHSPSLGPPPPQPPPRLDETPPV